MALDVDGKLFLLAGRLHLSVKRLSDPTESVAEHPIHQKHDSGSVAEWNPTPGYQHQFVLSCNEKIICGSVRESKLSLSTSLKHHTRQVSHLNWHKIEPNQLATASADCTTAVWDTRDARRPVNVFTAVAGVDLVKWNNLSSHLLATSHDGDLRIWDSRKGTVPVQYIAAHLNKIHCIDWSKTHEYQLASCSQDCTVKLFDMTNPRRAESVMQTAGPVWRVSYTPWGEGLMTAVIPTTTDDSSMQLWNVSNHSVPAHSFVGPLDMLVEVQWRREGQDYQLVTWSRDHSLRLWRIEPFLQRLCGCPDVDARLLSESESEPASNDLADTEVGTIAGASTVVEQLSPPMSSSFSMGESTSMHLVERGATSSLEEEFDYLTSHEWNLPNVSCQSIDLANRSCTVIVTLDRCQISVLINFPPSYPYNAAPSFQVEESMYVDPVLKTKLLKVLKQTAQQRVRKNRTCLDSCLSQLVLCLEGSSIALAEERVAASRVPPGTSPARLADPASVYSSFHDAYIPYPKFSGARFCSVGMLVCFGRASRTVGRQEATPRSLSAATTLSFGGSYVGSYPRYAPGSSQETTDADFSFFLSERQSLSRALSRVSRTTKLPRHVTVYDTSKLFLVDKTLGEKYVLDMKDVAGSCVLNAAAAASVGRADLVQVWTLVSLAVAKVEQNSMPWFHHPFSSTLIDKLIRHYANISDIQTAAMLSCAFPTPPVEKPVISKEPSSAGSSPYHTIHPSDTSLAGWIVPILKHQRSNSWSESMEETPVTILEHRESLPAPRLKRSRSVELREELKRRYADMLHMWGLVEHSTRITKLLADPTEPHAGLEFLLDCVSCGRPVVGSAYCPACMKFALRCSICRVLVRGASNVCIVCGHGGHTSHIFQWFSNQQACPSGCGCNCASETRYAFDT